MGEARSSSENSAAVIWGLILVCILWVVYARSGTPPASADARIADDTQRQVLTRDEAIHNHWDEIKGYLEGTETVEACSLTAGNCYDLEADISSGSIDVLHFLNGGRLNFSADIDEDGSASDVDAEGNSWGFTLDMASDFVDEAIMKWAHANGHTVTD